MDAMDRALLDRIQAGVPLAPRPYDELGRALGLAETEVLARLGALREAGILRQISAIFDTARLGYRSVLVAASVAPDRIEAAAHVINAHPGVSHNYERGGSWNLWFTLAVPPSSRLGLEATAARLGAQARLERIRLLPAVRVFKIGVRLEMEEGGGALRDAVAGAGEAPGPAPGVEKADLPLVRVLQEPLALMAQPFVAPARVAGLPVEDLLARARALLAGGVMRRFAGLLRHRQAGFTANAMWVWIVPPERIDDVGAAMATFRAVSHCYQRPTYPDWPYSLFSMVHARTPEECVAVLDAIAEATGVREREVLWTGREFKKTRLRYFTPDYDAWEAAA